MAYFAHVLLTVVPFVAMAALGIILVWQHRTLATALAALGFSSVALSQIAGMFVGFFLFSGHGDFATAASRFGWTLPATHWGNVVGIWVGSLSLLWHTLRQANGSPNNRFERSRGTSSVSQGRDG
jgi:hypothetical protein